MISVSTLKKEIRNKWLSVCVLVSVMFPDERTLDDIDRYPLCINVSDEIHDNIYSKSIKTVKDWNVYPSVYIVLALLLKCEEKNRIMIQDIIMLHYLQHTLYIL